MSVTVEKSIVSHLKIHLCAEVVDRKPTEIADEQDLIGEGILDSLGILLLSDFIEGEYGIVIEPDEVVIENFSSLDAIARFVVTKRYPLVSET